MIHGLGMICVVWAEFGFDVWMAVDAVSNLIDEVEDLRFMKYEWWILYVCMILENFKLLVFLWYSWCSWVFWWFNLEIDKRERN